MEVRRTHLLVGAMIAAVVAAWLTSFFLKGNRTFTIDERKDLVLYATRRYVIAWALFGPRNAQETLKSVLLKQSVVTSLTFEQGTASFKVVFSNREEFSVGLGALPDTAFLPWWSLPIPPLLWIGRMAWKAHRRKKPPPKPRAKSGPLEWS